MFLVNFFFKVRKKSKIFICPKNLKNVIVLENIKRLLKWTLY
jgi:hypothetical protein